MKNTNSTLRALGSFAVICIILGVGYFFVRDTQWWSDLTETAEENSEVPSDLSSILSTATVTRANVADEGSLDGSLQYQDRVEFVHRIDPIETTVTQQVGAGRAAQTVSITTQEPGERAVTSLPEPGQIIASGDVLYESDSTPVYAAHGEVAAWRTMQDGVIGSDIAQLHEFLVNNGWAAEALIGEEWVSATTTAVNVWQEDTGQTVTGTVELGELWFIAGPIRITEIMAAEGLVVPDGEPLFTYTSQRRSLEATVTTLPDGLVSADDLEARLPDGSVVPAQIESIRGNDAGFDVVFTVDLAEADVPSVNGLQATVSWTVDEIVDALTLPPEALRRTDAGVYVVDVLDGDVIRTTEVEVVGQAGRVVAVVGVDERAEVLIP